MHNVFLLKVIFVSRISAKFPHSLPKLTSLFRVKDQNVRQSSAISIKNDRCFETSEKYVTIIFWQQARVFFTDTADCWFSPRREPEMFLRRKKWEAAALVLQSIATTHAWIHNVYVKTRCNGGHVEEWRYSEYLEARNFYVTLINMLIKYRMLKWYRKKRYNPGWEVKINWKTPR